MSRFSFEDLQPDAGYYADMADLPSGGQMLYVGFWLQHKFDEKLKVKSSPDRPILARDVLIWGAITEYMNAGGQLEDLRAELSRFCSDLDSKSAFNGCLDFKGWVHDSCGFNQHGNYVHEFRSEVPIESGDYVYARWVKDEFVESGLTESQLEERLVE